MPPFASTRAVTDGLIATLEATGLRVGDGARKDAQGNTIPVSLTDGPCAVVYPIPGGNTDGESESPLGDPDAFAQTIYQVTYVGATREQAEWARDKGRAAVMAGVTVTGHNVARVRLQTDAFVRDDSLPEPLFSAIDRHVIWTV
jgi:hypothetical protein